MRKRMTLSDNDAKDLRTVLGHDEKSARADQFGLFDLLRLWLAHRKAIGYVVAATIILTAAIVFLIPNKYRSIATILPSGPQDQLAELKALAGIGTLSTTDENSSDLFPDILQSQAVVDPVLQRSYSFTHDGKPITVRLSDYFDESNPDKLRRALLDVTSILADKKTGIIEVAVETKYAELSQAVAGAFISELENFNLNKRRSHAKDNAAYLARELEAAKVELGKAEDALESLQNANLNWNEASSPDLLKSLGQLQRDVEIENKKYLYLTQEYEIAKLDVQKDVPVVRTLDTPSLPDLKCGPKRLLIIVTMTLIALVGSLFGVTVAEIFRQRTHGPDLEVYSNLQREWREALPARFQAGGRTAEAEVLEEVAP